MSVPMVSHTCINRIINMTTFMLSFKISGNLNTASDNHSQGKGLFKCDLKKTGKETNKFCLLQ